MITCSGRRPARGRRSLAIVRGCHWTVRLVIIRAVGPVPRRGRVAVV